MRSLIRERALTAVFQPILAIHGASIIGYEGLIRGPVGSPLHAPLALFEAAERADLFQPLEQLCREVVIEAFARLDLPGKLFLNVSPESLLAAHYPVGMTLQVLQRHGVSPQRIVIELTESKPIYDYALLRDAVLHYRNMGFSVAMDDLGEGFSSLRLWSELQPEFVKIDKHFVQGLDRDSVKLQFVRSIQQIAENCGAQVVAEGIETPAELAVIKDLGLAMGQGFLIARPEAEPIRALPEAVGQVLSAANISVYPVQQHGLKGRVSAGKLLRDGLWVAPDTPNEEVYALFADDPELHSVPVVEQQLPLGLLRRHQFLEIFARPFNRELYGKRPCHALMDRQALMVDKGTSLQDLSQMVVSAGQKYLADGFIITDRGRYLGIGTGHDLIREITDLQISAARYANPLTLLPGNVPINEHIERLVAGRVSFVACYCDLDSFKPFNDLYGYRRGDDVIQYTGDVLSRVCQPGQDFLGHIGGDDFLILFQSPDWQQRCVQALTEFDHGKLGFFEVEHLDAGGYATQDRRGEPVFHALVALSIGAVPVTPDLFVSHHEISTAAADAKKQAKKREGSCLFVERRQRGADWPAARGEREAQPEGQYLTV